MAASIALEPLQQPRCVRFKCMHAVLAAFEAPYMERPCFGCIEVEVRPAKVHRLGEP